MTSLTQVAASSWGAITALLVPIEVAPLRVVRHGAVTRRASSRPWSTCQSFPQAAGCAGGWPAIRAALAKAGALTPLILLVAHRFRVKHRVHGLALLRIPVRRGRRVTYSRFPARTSMAWNQPRRRARRRFRVRSQYQQRLLTLRPHLLRCLTQVRRNKRSLTLVATGLWPVQPGG
jgi:hypothetical protein